MASNRGRGKEAAYNIIYPQQEKPNEKKKQRQYK